MKYFVGVLMLFSLFGTAFSAADCSARRRIDEQPEKLIASARRILLLNGQLSFVPPTGFHRTTKERLKYKLPDNFSPLLLLTDDRQSGYVAVGQDDGMYYQRRQIVEVKKFIEGTFHAAGASWITSEMEFINEREWFSFIWEDSTSELANLKVPLPEGQKPKKIWDESPARSSEHYTILNGKIISISFVSPIRKYPQLEKVFERSIRSIEVKD